MEKFSLEKYLENPSRKVVTRDGRPVRIVCTDSPNPKCPIYGFVEGDTGITSWRSDGSFSNLMDSYDLFFADEELTEFEQKLVEIVKSEGAPIGNLENFTDTDKEAIHCYSKQLLDLARKELRKEQQEKLGTLEMPIDVTEPYYIQGKQDALKGLPKWKKATEHKEFEVHVCVMDEDMFPYLDTEVTEGEYYIELSDLKNLPEEK